MIVDAHHHFWRPGPGMEWLNAGGLDVLRRPFGPAEFEAQVTADRTILVEAGRCDTAEAAELFAYAREASRVAGVVAWADPAAPDLARTLDTYRSLPGGDRLVGIRSQVQAETDPGYLDRPDVRRGLRTIAAHGLVFDLVIRPDQLDAAARVAAAVPEARFVLDHLGKPGIRDGGFTPWSVALARLAACPNVTAKLSGLVTEADHHAWRVADLRPYVAEAVSLFGADRLMFGSDWPVCLLAASYARVREALVAALPAMPPAAVPSAATLPAPMPSAAVPSAAMSPAAMGQIFGGTAARVYGLGS